MERFADSGIIAASGNDKQSRKKLSLSDHPVDRTYTFRARPSFAVD